jgi:hypothetical protein
MDGHFRPHLFSILLIGGNCYHFSRPTTHSRANRDFPVHRKRGLWTELTRGRWGLFHGDPKRIVGVLRVTLLNRLNDSREWPDLPLSR